MPDAVEVRDLVKSYGPVEAVRGVTLNVTGGEIFGLLGPNGAGKTTTIECILGLRAPDKGSIFIEGMDAIAQNEKVKQIVGAQLQATAMQDKLTPREALKFFGAFYRNSIKPSQLIDRFNLAEKADSPFDSLSGGQKQRLALALAFVYDPRVIFLDEPTAGLDPHSRRELHEDIARLKADGRTVLLSTHYIEEAHRLCDRIAIINHGRIIATGSPEQLIRSAGIPDKVVAVTDRPMDLQKLTQLSAAGKVTGANLQIEITASDVTNLMIGLLRLVESEQIKLIDLRIERASLEEAFLKITGAADNSDHESGGRSQSAST